MSDELTKARSILAGVGIALKRGNTFAAVSSVLKAVVTTIKHPLLKNEKQEFQTLIHSAITRLSNDKNLQSLSPVKLTYEPGKERQLCLVLRDICSAIEEHIAEEGRRMALEAENRKARLLAEAQALLDDREHDRAVAMFDSIVQEGNDSTELREDIAGRLMKANLYAEAVRHLEEALRNNPNAIYLYNQIGIARRKLKDYGNAETYFKKALECSASDCNLFFNVSRLYIDMERWEDARKAAMAAIALNPEFKEANQILSLISRRLR